MRRGLSFRRQRRRWPGLSLSTTASARCHRPSNDASATNSMLQISFAAWTICFGVRSRVDLFRRGPGAHSPRATCPAPDSMPRRPRRAGRAAGPHLRSAPAPRRSREKAQVKSATGGVAEAAPTLDNVEYVMLTFVEFSEGTSGDDSQHQGARTTRQGVQASCGRGLHSSKFSLDPANGAALKALLQSWMDWTGLQSCR